ncbi:hypothetical protein R3P38DRAFT_2376016, partial [Favolaschia claudopus]
STSVCPVWCAGTSCEAFFPEGDNEYDEVQCSDCKWWSHIRCLPKGINWHDPAVEFICRRCKLYVLLLSFEFSSINGHAASNTRNWYFSLRDVRWYPARFLRRDRQQQGTNLEFEFVWLDCVENAVSAGQKFSVSREFCKAYETEPFQLPKVRMPRYLDPNFTSHNNPQLEAIFDSAIPSIATILS